MRRSSIFANESLQSARCRRRREIFRCLIFFILIGLLDPMQTRGTPPNGENNTTGRISSAEARIHARKGLFAIPWIDEIKLPVPKKALTAGEPLLVQRIDRRQRFYYLVPFTVKHKTWVVVIVDAATGRFKESAKMRTAGIYPSISSAQAEKILKEHLPADGPEYPRSAPPPALVWRPCRQTQSPYEPLWLFRIKGVSWFIDQTGKVHQRIEELPLKGAGPGP